MGKTPIGKTKAEVSFQNGLNRLLAPTGIVHDLGSDHEALGDSFEINMLRWNQPLDTEATTKLFFQYGTYLELIGGEAPVGEPRFFEWPRLTASEEEMN